MVVNERARGAIGMRVRRVDGAQKVTGQARYGDDLPLYGLLHARLVPSVYAHARIVSVDGAKASQLPGVLGVHTAGDLSDILKSPPTSRAREVLAQGVARYCGQPIAVVIAESDAAAEDAVALVDVQYEELPAVLDPEAALKPGAPSVWPDGVPGATSPTESDDSALQSPNLADYARYDRGDLAAGLADADVVVTRSYQTSIVHQSYLEPHTTTAAVDPLGQEGQPTPQVRNGQREVRDGLEQPAEGHPGHRQGQVGLEAD